MHILKTVQFYFPFEYCGGPVVKIRGLARALARRGHQVTVLTPDLGINSGAYPEIRVERCRWGWQSQEEGVQVCYLSTYVRHRSLTFNPTLMGFCGAFLGRVSLLHCYGLYDLNGPATSYFCKRRKIPYVIEPMGMYRPIDRSLRLKRFWHSTLGNRHCQNAARIVTNSELEQNELLEDGVPPEKVVARYDGVGPDIEGSVPPRGSFRSKWGIHPDESLIIFLGRLIPRKGADLLIQAFAQACPESGRLIIAGPEGEPGYCSQLSKLVQDHDCDRRVLFTGPLYGDEKRALLADADLFVLPSRYENFAIAAAEAITFGVPVIVSDCCGIGSLVKDRAGLVIPLSKDSLVNGLARMLSEKALYRRLKNGCQDVADQFSWLQLARQMEEQYTRVLEDSSGAVHPTPRFFEVASPRRSRT